MKKVDEILARTESGLPQQSWTSKTSTGDLSEVAEESTTRRVISDQTKALVNMVFARFMAIYGHKFKSAFETEQEIMLAKREWAMSIQRYSENELVAAVNRCKAELAWMPSISEFLKLLNEVGGDHGLPSAFAAYQEACQSAEHPLQHSWSHPAIYFAGRETGWFELRSESESEIFPRFSYHYDLLCRRVREGERLDIPNPIAIEQKSDVTQANQMLEFAKRYQIDESEACQLLYYLTLPKGSKVRARQFALSQETASTHGWQLPTEA